MCTRLFSINDWRLSRCFPLFLLFSNRLLICRPVCELGCSECADGTGECITCRPDLTIDPNHTTQCIWAPAVLCPTGSFSADGQCSKCSLLCGTCKGPTEKNCTLCIGGLYFFGGDCRITDGDGVCQATNGMVANRVKNTCDGESSFRNHVCHFLLTRHTYIGCGEKCTSCKIPNFYQGSDELLCTDCLPGFFLFQGKCVADCPTGTFPPKDDNICTSKNNFFPSPTHTQHRFQIAPPLAVLVQVLPISVLHAQVVNLHLRANASLRVLQIHFRLPVPVLNVILTVPPVLDHPSTNATPADPPAQSSLLVDACLHAPNLNFWTPQLRHVKLVTPAALRVLDRVQGTASDAQARVRFCVAVHVFLRTVKTRAASYLDSVYVCLNLWKFQVLRRRHLNCHLNRHRHLSHHCHCHRHRPLQPHCPLLRV